MKLDTLQPVLKTSAAIGLMGLLGACSTLDFGPEPGSVAYEQNWCESAGASAPVDGNRVNPPLPESSSNTAATMVDAPGVRGECAHAADRRAQMAGLNGENP